MIGTSRLEAFSDGVFAVAITLLVLDLKVAGPGHGSLVNQLGDTWPNYAAYLVSFLVIGIIWINHHTLMTRFASVDRPFLFFNLLLLLFVTVIPFPTALVAQYLRQSGSDAHVAAALYGVVMEGMGLSFSAMFVWGAAHPHLLHHTVSAEEHRGALRGFGVGSVLYLLAIALAFVSAPAALAAHFAIAVYYVFDRTAVRRAQEGPTSPGR